MTVQWYLYRIRKVIAEIRRSSNAALSSDLKQRAEVILHGLRDIKEWDDFDWEDDYVFYKFKNYVVENQGRMEHWLRGVNYDLAAASAPVSEDRLVKVRSTRSLRPRLTRINLSLW